MMEIKVGDIIELKTDTLALYQVNEKGIKLIARGLDFIEKWDKEARKEYYKTTAEGWRDSDGQHSQELKDKMYKQLMEEHDTAEEIYVTIEQLQENLNDIRKAYGEPDNEEIGRVGVENRWKFYVDKLMNYPGVWWLKPRGREEFPSHYGIASWYREMEDLGVDYWAWDRY